MLKTILRKLFGDPYAFRRVDYPGFADHELPKTLLEVDRQSAAVRLRQRLNRQIKFQASIAQRHSARRAG